MAGSWLLEPPLVARAQRLFTISSVAPLTVLLAVTAVMILGNKPDNPNVESDTDILFTIVGALVGIGVTWQKHWLFRNNPVYWRVTAGYIAFWLICTAYGVMVGRSEDWRLGLSTPVFTGAVVVVILGIVLLSWFPAKRAARLVLDDLSPDVVNSSLVIEFGSHKPRNTLRVTPDSLELMPRGAGRKPERSYPLTDISAISVRTEDREREYPVPGLKDRSIGVKPGEVVVFELPGGEIVFAAEDVERIKRFVEERRAVVLAE